MKKLLIGFFALASISVFAQTLQTPASYLEEMRDLENLIGPAFFVMDSSLLPMGDYQCLMLTVVRNTIKKPASLQNGHNTVEIIRICDAPLQYPIGTTASGSTRTSPRLLDIAGLLMSYQPHKND